MSKPRWIEILDVAVQILKLVIATAADIVDDGKINGSVGDVERNVAEDFKKSDAEFKSAGIKTFHDNE